MAGDGVRVWRVAVRTGDGAWDPDEKELSTFVAHLRTFNREEECAKVMKYRFARDKKAAIVGRLLIRWFLLRCGIATAGVLPVGRVHGKPFLQRAEKEREEMHIDFNLSHAGAWTIFVGCCCPRSRPTFAISCDVMPLEIRGRDKHQGNFFQTLSDTLTGMEWTRIRQGHLSEREQLARFFEHWTLKESYIKAVAVGLAMPLEDIEFRKPVNDRFMTRERPDDIDTSATVFIKRIEKKSWYFEQQWLDEDHVVAVATCPLSEVDSEYARAAYSSSAIAESGEFPRVLEPGPFQFLTPRDLLT